MIFVFFLSSFCAHWSQCALLFLGNDLNAILLLTLFDSTVTMRASFHYTIYHEFIIVTISLLGEASLF